MIRISTNAFPVAGVKVVLLTGLFIKVRWRRRKVIRKRSPLLYAQLSARCWPVVTRTLNPVRLLMRYTSHSAAARAAAPNNIS